MNSIPGFAQENYVEAAWRSSMPTLLKHADGDTIDTPEKWFNIQRPHILDLFKTRMYGTFPENAEVGLHFIKSSEQKDALGGKAVKKEVIIRVYRGQRYRDLWLLVYLPVEHINPVPVFLGLNFNGNHSIADDPNITITPNWIDENTRLKRYDPDKIDQSRGTAASRWPIELILSRGYGVATMFYGDIDPDYDDGFQDGIHPFFYEQNQSEPHKEEWGSIGVWAWGLSRAIDYFEKDQDIDNLRVVVLGHSRLGKTALWAGATDQRVALTISNNSGCGGAALSVRKSGETIENINTAFPHWFCDNFLQYNRQEEQLPMDQHMLLALIAPRAVYVASAEEDLWADPVGEYLSAYYAQPVFELLGKQTTLDSAMPSVNRPLKNGFLGYHIRTGEHNVTTYDWMQFLDFADLHLAKPGK